MCFFFNKQFRTCANALPNEFTVQVVWMYEYCAGKHWSLDWMGENKTATYSFVLGYLRMILWKISTGISIKHRILVAQWVRALHLTTYTSLSPMRRGFAPGFVNYKKGCTRLAAASDKVYQLLAHGRWFSLGTPASSATKTGRHDIAEILLKVALKHQKSINQSNRTLATFNI